MSGRDPAGPESVEERLERLELEVAWLRVELTQLRAELGPLVKLTTELLQERYLRGGED